MKKYQRRDTLEKLLEMIYGITTVNFDRKKYERGRSGKVNINKNGLFDKNSYKLTMWNNFDALFDITFNVPEHVFAGNNRNDYTEFTRDIAIQNAIKYFEEFGIKVSNCFENKHEKDLFSKLIYKLISTELLSVIFNTDDNRKKRKVENIDMDDITPDFTIAINNVKAVLESKDIVSILYRNAKMSDIETLYDNDTKDPKSKYNHVTCIYTEDIYALVYEPWFFDPSIELNVSPKPHEVNTSKEACFSILIEQLKERSLLLPIDGDTAFGLPEDLFTEQRNGENITIRFLINTATVNFLPSYFYYAPELCCDSNDFSSNGSATIPSEVTIYQNIRRNAAKALRERYMANFKQYYENVLYSIITNINILTSIDYGYLLNSNLLEEAETSKALAPIALDVNKLYGILSDRFYEDSDIKALIIWLILHSVDMLNNEIDGIISLPHRIGSDTDSPTESKFITQLRDYVSKYDIREFVAKIEAYFEKLQQVEELFEANHSDVYGKIEEVDAYISIDVKSEFGSTNKKLTEINLDEAVFKTFHQNLIQLTSVLKENNNAPA